MNSPHKDLYTSGKINLDAHFNREHAEKMQPMTALAMALRALVEFRGNTPLMKPEDDATYKRITETHDEIMRFSRSIKTPETTS